MVLGHSVDHRVDAGLAAICALSCENKTDEVRRLVGIQQVLGLSTELLKAQRAPPIHLKVDIVLHWIVVAIAHWRVVPPEQIFHIVIPRHGESSFWRDFRLLSV